MIAWNKTKKKKKKKKKKNRLYWWCHNNTETFLLQCDKFIYSNILLFPKTTSKSGIVFYALNEIL